MTMTDEAPPRPRWVRGTLVGAAALVLVLATVLVVLWISGDDEHMVDEDAWRAAREAQLGHDFKDWPTYRDIWLDRCGKEDLDIDIALLLDDGRTVDEIRTDLTYACPARVADLDAYVKWSKDPCAGYDAEARKRIEEASGVPC